MWEDEISEVSAMNLFVLWKTAKDQIEVITCPTNGLILPGITRKSVIQLLKDMDYNLIERTFTIWELIEACEKKRVLEMWGTGTACAVCPVKSLTYDGAEYKIPIDAKTNSGPLTARLYKQLQDIQQGRIEHKWCVVADEANLTGDIL